MESAKNNRTKQGEGKGGGEAFERKKEKRIQSVFFFVEAECNRQSSSIHSKWLGKGFSLFSYRTPKCFTLLFFLFYFFSIFFFLRTSSEEIWLCACSDKIGFFYKKLCVCSCKCRDPFFPLSEPSPAAFSRPVLWPYLYMFFESDSCACHLVKI